MAEALAGELAEAAAKGASTLLISNEHLHSRIHTLKEAQQVVDLVAPHVERIEGLIYLRRQDRLAISLHSTRLKLDSGSSADIFPRTPSTLRYYNYLGLADLWESALGEGNLRLRRFDSTHLKDGDLLADYLSAAGLPGDVLNDCKRPKPLNESLSPEAQTFLELFNRRVPRYINGDLNPMRGSIVSILEKHFPGSKPTLSRQKAVEFYEQFVESNRELAMKFGLDEPLFNDDFSMYPEIDAATSVSFQDAVDIACALWIAQRTTILRLEKKRSTD